jgi:hypothetical protein
MISSAQRRGGVGFLSLDRRREVGYALRSLKSQSMFPIATVPTLVLRIGPTHAVFTVIKAVLLNRLPATQGCF